MSYEINGSIPAQLEAVQDALGIAAWAAITPGAGVGAALSVPVGSAGAFTTFNGAGGTPSSLTLVNAAGLPVAGITPSTTTPLGVGSLELGNVSDTTLTRFGAGDVAVEGNLIYRAGGTDVPITDGGTGASTAADARTNLATVGSAALVAASGGTLVGFQDAAAGSPLTSIDAYLRSLAVNVKMTGAVGNGIADDTAAVQRAIDTGKNVYFPYGQYAVNNLTGSTTAQVLFTDSDALLLKNGNGPLITHTGARPTFRHLAFIGTGFTGHGVVLTGNNPTLFDCASYNHAGRAVLATGSRVQIVGTRAGGIYATTDTSATGYDIEIGVSGTATLYHYLSDIYSSQVTGGILLTDTGSHGIFGGQFGKLTIKAGTSPAGVNGGMTTGCRILGNVDVELSNAVFTGNQFSSITFTCALGTSGLTYVGNLESSGFSMVSNATTNQFILRHDAGGVGGYITYMFGPSNSLAKLQVDPASGDWVVPNGNVQLNASKVFQFGTNNKRLGSSATNLQLTNTDGALQLTGTGLVQAIVGTTVYSFDADSLNLPTGAVIELGHASDTTIARASAGNISVEGNIVYRAGGTDVPITDGGTGASTAADARTNLATVGTAALAASSGSSLIGTITSFAGGILRTLAAWIADRPVSVKAFGAVGDGVTDDTAALNLAFASGATSIMFPPGIYRASGLTCATNNVRIYGRGDVVIQNNANGTYLLTLTGNNPYVEGIRLNGDAASPTFTSGGFRSTGDNAVYVRCSAQWFTGAALRHEGSALRIHGTAAGGVWQTTTAAGFEIDIGVSGTATYYHHLEYVYTSQATGGIRLTDTGFHTIVGGQFGKLSILSGTSPSGVNGGSNIGSRILGDIVIGLSNCVLAGNLISAVNLTINAGVGGVRIESNTIDPTAVITNNSTTSNIIVLEANVGGQMAFKYGGSTSLAVVGYDPASGDQYITNGHTHYPVDHGVVFGAVGSITAGASNMAVINTVGSIQHNSPTAHDFLIGGVKKFSVNTAGRPQFDGGTQTTVGAAGGGSALPATPTGYIIVNVGGTEFVMPYYAKA